MQRSPALTPDDAIYRKIARRIVPFLFICYVVNFIDRVNIGFAKLQFLQDLKLDDAVFGFAAGMFFVGYLLFELPSNLLLDRIGVRKTLLRIMVLWGLLTVLLMFVRSASVLYLLRFLLGAAEAGFFPGIILYLTYWFPDRQRGRITSLFIMAVPLAGIIGGPLSGWIMGHFHNMLGLRGWQWLFLIEGVPAILLGVMAMLYLDDRPMHAKWLSDAEKAHISAALDTDRQQRGARHAPPARLSDVLRNPRIYLLSAIYFCVFMGLNAVGFWIPTLLRHVGVQQIGNIGWLSGAISVCTAIGIVVIGRSSDRHAERRWHVACCGFAVAGSFLLLPLAAHSVPFTVALLVVASTCIYATLSIFWTIPTAYLDGGAAAAGIATITAIGAIGGAVSPSLVGMLKAETGSVYAGFAVIAALLIAGMVALLRAVPAPHREAVGTVGPVVLK
ncbi:MFS transporter [Paraburkholderia fungorum]|uniref:MFS transporter n=1 Tax=Paraburkholderia fungorum TaxID=134537 RepID=UPI0004AA7BAE|nr:MFS transporter [Paraburkholderia fungorum]KFX65067.1 major facilitator transporter [Burkholderia sp. K24]USX06133.1 MFS transporter [Paraburkholderia fungorum]